VYLRGHDSYYSLAYTEKNFQEFLTAGGQGQLFEVPDLPGEGHFLVGWPEKWVDAVTAYLDRAKGAEATAVRAP
jgi:hypothetical protein